MCGIESAVNQDKFDIINKNIFYFLFLIFF